MHLSLPFSPGVDAVKQNFLAKIEEGFDQILSMKMEESSIRGLELSIWDYVIDIAQMVMSVKMSHQCQEITKKDIQDRGLSNDQVKLRNNRDYHYTMMTTFGAVMFLSFAYIDYSNSAQSVTRNPAREQLFPLHKHCRSSELCLEWEAKLGQEMPFRRAQEALFFFTHGAVSLEDNTINDHMVTVSQLIDREWLYKTPETIREVLLHQATRDLKTGQPLLYLSSDAHALRRFVDETWDARWKMANGLRLWCIDKNTGEIIHLGGEYTWGDCHRVGEIVDWLIETGHVPADGDYGNGLVAKVIIPTDGMQWFEEHIIEKFSENAVPILDPHHVVKRLKEYAQKRYGKNQVELEKFYKEAMNLLFGPYREKKKKSRKLRKVSKDAKNTEKTKDEMDKVENKTDKIEDKVEDKIEKVEDKTEKVEEQSMLLSWEACELIPESVEILIGRLLSEEDITDEVLEAKLNLIDYLENNIYRMNYVLYRSLGYQLGSGAMESLHRSASQIRLKLPGLKACAETSQAIFNLRMLHLCGRWDEFWNQPNFYDQLVKVFSPKPENPVQTLAEAA